MFKRIYEKLNKKLKEKKGASLAVVVISMSLLVIMGTTFATMAFNSYKNSYGSACRQQAQLTAKGVLDAFVDRFRSIDGGVDLRQYVSEAVKQAEISSSVKKSQTKAKININGLTDEVINSSSEKEKLDVSLYAMYLVVENPTEDDAGNIIKDPSGKPIMKEEYDKSKIIVTSRAVYSGFESSLSCTLANTSKASEELRKIMSNCLYFTSPIVNYIYNAGTDNKGITNNNAAVEGNVYIDAPLWLEGEKKNPYHNVATEPNDPLGDGTTHERIYGHTLTINNEGKTIVGGTIETDSFIKDGEGRFVPKLNDDGSVKYVDSEDEIPSLTLTYGRQDFDYDAGKYEFDENGLMKPEYFPQRYYSGSLADPDFSFNHNEYELKVDYETGEILYVPSNPDDKTYVILNQQGHDYVLQFEKVLVDGKEVKNALGQPKYQPKRDENNNLVYALAPYQVQYKQTSVYNTATGAGIVGRDHIFSSYDQGSYDYYSIYETVDINTGEKIQVLGQKHPGAGGNWENYTETDPNKVAAGYIGTGNRVEVYKNKKGWHYWKYYDGGGKGKKDVDPQINGGKPKIHQTCIMQRARKSSIMQIPDKKHKEITSGTPNQWTEVYIRSLVGDGGSISDWTDVPISIWGNLKCNTDVLLGLHNRGIVGNYSGNFWDTLDHTKQPGVSHGYEAPVSFDFSEGGFFENHRRPAENCLVVHDDIFVNGNVRGENLICYGNLYANAEITETKNDKGKTIYNSNNKGNVFLQVEDEWVVGFNLPWKCTYIHIKGDIVADGYVSVFGSPMAAIYNPRAKVDGNIIAGKTDKDGNLIGTPGSKDKLITSYRYYHSPDYFNNISGDATRYQLGAGDVLIHKADVGGSVYAAGNVWISSGSTIKGDVYAAGDIYIDGNSRVEGTVVSQGTIHIISSAVGVKDGKTATDKYLYAGKDLKVRKDGSDPGIDVKTAFVQGNCDMDDVYQRATMFVVGNLRIKNSWVYEDMYCLGDFNAAGNLIDMTTLFEESNVYTLGKVVKKNISKAPLELTSDTALRNATSSAKAGAKVLNGTDFAFLMNPMSITLMWNMEKHHYNIPRGISLTAKKYMHDKGMDELIDAYRIATSANIKKWSFPESRLQKIKTDVGLLTESTIVSECYKTINKNLPEGSKIPVDKVIKNNFILSELKLDGETLVIDTSKHNIHIKVTGDISLKAKGDIPSKILVMGGNMAFIYLENNKAQHEIYVDKTCVLGKKIKLTGANDTSIKDQSTEDGKVVTFSGLHIVSIDPVDVEVCENVEIYSFNYLPRGYLNMKLPTDGKANLTGSYVIENITGNTIKSMYTWKVRFKSEETPIIIDGGQAPQYGNNADEIKDYGSYDWEVINYN